MRTKLLFLFTLLLLWSCKEESQAPSASQSVKTNSYKVAVIMPQDNWGSMKPVAEQALQNVAKAQGGLAESVALSLEWIDESAANLKEEVYRITHDNT